MQLKIYLRHTQYLAFEADAGTGITVGDPIIYTGLNTATLKPVKGTVPSPEYQDFTDCIELENLTITWTAQRNDKGELDNTQLQRQKAASGTLQFEDRAYHFIKNWIVDHIAAPLNSIDVKIEHVGCGMYQEFVIKPTQIQWCDDGNCIYELNLQQKDEPYQCIQKTLIDDNWQGWFHKHTTKKHPRFVYCNEGRPIAIMVGMWYISTLLFLFMIQITGVILVIQAIVALIKDIVNIIIGVINGIIWLVGGNKIGKIKGGLGNTDWFDPTKVMKSFYTETSGCGYTHVAPLIRDYITNVCDKCGIKVDRASAPIFFAEYINIDTSAEREEGIKSRENPYYWATYLAPTTTKGYRRMKRLFGQKQSPIYYWNEANAPLLSLEQLLNQLKVLFNAEWRIQTDAKGQPTLYFWRKDWYYNGKILYNFRDGEDRLKILRGMCFSWNDNVLPTFISGLYGDDAMDSCGNLAKYYYNDKVSIANKVNSALFSGEYAKNSEFSPAKFRQDGLDEDYLMDAVRVIMNTTITAPFIVDTITRLSIVPTLKEFDYALLMSDNNNSKPKVIIWDERSGYDFAKAWRKNNVLHQFEGYSADQSPRPNPYYNPELKKFREVYDTKSTVNNASEDEEGIYYSLPNVNWNKEVKLVNYPMYFMSKFKDNLYDWFHWIDDPNLRPYMNMNWEVDIDLCCEDLKKLGLFEDSGRVKLLERVRVPNQYYDTGVITEIEVNYQNGDGESIGKHIKIKGIL